MPIKIAELNGNVNCSIPDVVDIPCNPHCSVQWINDTSWAGGNETTKWYSFPITFNKQVLASVLSDTNGKIAEDGTEGAIITEYYTSGLTVKCSWTNGFADKNISIIIVGF